MHPKTTTALLARHNFLGFPYRHGFTPAALRQLLAEVGFNVLEVKGAGVLPTERLLVVESATSLFVALRMTSRVSMPSAFSDNADLRVPMGSKKAW